MSDPAAQVWLRDVQSEDLAIFYEHQLDREASEMAAFPSRDCKTFMRNWERILSNHEIVARTILFNCEVAGNIVSAVYSDKREVGYWLGRQFWGKGIASRALALFLEEETTRPIYAHVAKHNLASRRVLEKCGFQVVREQRNLLFMKLAESADGAVPSDTP